MKKLTLLALAALLAATTAHAGWWQTFGGAERDEGTCVQQTSDGGYIVTGVTWSFGRPNESDIWLIKLDSLGHTEWTREYEAGWGFSVRQTYEGGYIIAGSKLIKTDSNGNTIWTRPYPCRCVQETDDKHYILTGGGLELMKVSKDGDSLWARNYEKGNAGSGCSYVEQTFDGGYILTGVAIDTLDEYIYKASLWLLKTDEDGDTLWTKTYGGDNWHEDDDGNCVRQTDDGGYIVTGILRNSILLKTDENGDSIWSKGYGGGEGHCVEQTLDGGYIVVGGTESATLTSTLAGTGNLWLIKTDENGDTVWTREYGGEDVDAGRYVQQTSDSGYIATGYTWSFGPGGYDLWVLKTDSLGLLAVAEKPVSESTKNWDLLSFVGSQIILRYSESPQGFRANIYDASGRKVNEIYSSNQAGILTWGAEQVPGVYFIRVKDNNRGATTAKAVLVH